MKKYISIFPILFFLIILMKIAQADPSQDLIQAVKTNDLAGIEAALTAGADVNTTDPAGKTALMIAAYGGSVEVVQYLIAHGADVNYVTFYGETALMSAAMGGNEPVVALLLEKGAEINAKDQVIGSALAYAANDGHLGVVQLLIAHGAEIDAHEDEWTRNTPLIYAATAGHLEIVRFLITKGADVFLENAEGVSAIAVTSDSLYLEIQPFLREHFTPADIAQLELERNMYKCNVCQTNVDNLQLAIEQYLQDTQQCPDRLYCLISDSISGWAGPYVPEIYPNPFDGSRMYLVTCDTTGLVKVTIAGDAGADSCCYR